MTEITNFTVTDLLMEQNTLMNEAAQLLTSFLSNLFGFFEDFVAYNAKQRPEAVKVIQETEELSKKLNTYIDSVHHEIYALTGAMKDSDRELAYLRSENSSLSAALAEKDKMLKTLQSKREAEKKFAVVQANYTAAMGSIMGSMLWKTSKSESSINTYIEEMMIGEFISVANVSINSFVESYPTVLPLPDANEYKFMVSILGVSVNISAHRAGREYFVHEDIGITFISNVLDHLSSYPLPSGHLLKRMSLMFLFNVIILRRGARIVKASSNGVSNILGCLSPDNSDEIQTLALEFMIFFLEQIPPSDDVVQKIRGAFSKDYWDLLMRKDENTRDSCLKLYKMVTEYSPDSSA